MYESLKPFFPNGPTNRTDPIVRHDSGYSSEAITMLYKPQRDYIEGGYEGTAEDAVQKDAIHYPLIRINNHVLQEEAIIRFTLHNDRFMPYLDLVFRDMNNTIQFADMPGLDNVITVVMIENHPNAHRPIKMDFYVTDCNVVGDTFYVWAEFKCLPLEKQQFKQEVFHWPTPGCTASPWCCLPPNFHPTTYEFLHVIAENCGLGFSATQKCRSIKDDRYRILKKQKYKDLAQEHAACGGLDENSLFDTWIDPWGMLVMVNLPWVMAEPVKPDELASVISTGLNTADRNSDGAKVSPGMVHRLLSNVSMVTGINNMMIKSIEKLVDLKTGYYNGTLTEYNTVEPEGYKESKNGLKPEQIQEREASMTAAQHQDSFEFHNQEFSGFEMSLLTPTVQQRRRHDEYFKQQRANMFKVTLQEPNFGLERGMLCMILWFTDNTTQKAIILDQRPNLHPDDAGDPQKKKDLGENTVLDNEYQPLMDVAISGMYYIDGTDWEYENDGQKIEQHLYLFKKAPITQYYDKTGVTRFTKMPSN